MGGVPSVRQMSLMREEAWFTQAGEPTGQLFSTIFMPIPLSISSLCMGPISYKSLLGDVEDAREGQANG